MNKLATLLCAGALLAATVPASALDLSVRAVVDGGVVTYRDYDDRHYYPHHEVRHVHYYEPQRVYYEPRHAHGHKHGQKHGHRNSHRYDRHVRYDRHDRYCRH